jgi:LytS/YehU family sensor histidine kinase
LLEGYSSKWENTKDHTVIFSKLPPSRYVFRIRASLNSNFKDASEISYAFIINPYFWQRWWFRLLVATILAGLIMIVIRRREARIRKIDKLKQEKIEFQFETLRSQVNPHFLFNSFNTLITVIENSPNLAVEYVEKLSEFFRNIVNYREVNLILVQEEIKLLDNYIFIQKKRYGDNLILEILIDENIRKSKYVPPLTLQLLAENAIKHNAVSKESTLKILISAKNNTMEISNNINPKIGNESSTGMGLQNIINRYELLTIEKIEIKKDANIFSVKIPLLTSKNESLNT